MTSEEQGKQLEIIFNKIRSIQVSKSHDYANIDVLSNFKMAGEICGIGAEKQVLSLIATKVARLGVLLGSTDNPNHESIEDSMIDLANYAILMIMVNRDK